MNKVGFSTGELEEVGTLAGGLVGLKLGGWEALLVKKVGGSTGGLGEWGKLAEGLESPRVGG